MKKLCVLLVLVVFLCGCRAEQTFETLADEYLRPAAAQMKEISLRLPDDAAAQTIRGENGVLYLCDGYDVTVQTLEAGNLNATVKSLTGFGRESLTVIETSVEQLQKYECVWTAAGEGGDIVGRALILDDGAFHYCITVTAAAQEAPDLLSDWQELMDSVSIL